MNLLRCATHMVADLDAAIERFERWLDYSVVERGAVPPDLAQGWGAPASAGRPFAVCRPASGADVFLRFIEAEPVPGYLPIRSYGWAAIEICVQDVLAVHERMLGSPFDIIGPPSKVGGLPTIHPMQVRGPDLETVYLTEILNKSPDSGLPIAGSPIDKLFILVLACRDMPATARWFGETLGLDLTDPVAIRYSMINKAFGLPPETLHELVTAKHAGDVFLEFDAYPSGTVERPTRAGELPPGIAICTMTYPNLAGLKTTPRTTWLSPPLVREGPLYAGRLTGVMATPEGALIELVEGP